MEEIAVIPPFALTDLTDVSFSKAEVTNVAHWSVLWNVFPIPKDPWLDASDSVVSAQVIITCVARLACDLHIVHETIYLSYFIP